MRIKTLSIVFLYIFSFILFISLFGSRNKGENNTNGGKVKYWEVQSIDTVKYSRDLAREKLNDQEFEKDIDKQVELIALTGATHIGIGTPYDEEFVPFLRKWVRAARKYGLKVWFRGNLSGWEEWFGYERITREEHTEKVLAFIKNNKDLFEDGDIFTSCTECENGGPGDPRMTGDVAGHRSFLINEYKVTDASFKALGKNVRSNFMSMNGDVANIVMDKATTKALGGIVVVDHYVKSPEVLAKDLEELAKKSGGKVVLGEFGAPVLDIHGGMSTKSQAQWIHDTLLAVSEVPSIIGVNYWTGVGGSTSVWGEDYTAKEAVEVLKNFYEPRVVEGCVIDGSGSVLRGVEVISGPQTVLTDTKGRFVFAAVSDNYKVAFVKKGYFTKQMEFGNQYKVQVTMSKENENILYRLKKFINSNIKLR